VAAGGVRRRAVAQVKAILFLPLRDNDGRDLTAERDEVENSLFMHFDGWTGLGVVQGAYRMLDGAKAVDHHFAFAILLDESRLPELEAIARTFKSKTTQEAIYLEVQYDVEVRFI
jgi:hypothetical protein